MPHQKKAAAPPEVEIPTALVEVPMSTEHSTTDVIRHVNIQLDTRDGWVFRAIGLGLSQSGARLRNGQRVGHGRSFTGDTLRWLLEQVEAAAPEAAEPVGD